MRTEVIKADTIDAAAERILDELKEDTRRSISEKGNVIYFDGWDGLGATAVLRAVAQRLGMASGAPAGLQFDQIIEIDCSKWESRRAFQRVIAEQLELPSEVMEMFDNQDEEDDFTGVPQDSRPVIEEVRGAMYRRIKELNHRFLVIFHNGSSKEIDLADFGFPLSKYFDNKVLWTFQGRFRLYPRMKVDNAMESSGTTQVFISASCQEKDPPELGAFLVRQEAAEVAREINTAGGVTVQPSQVAECFLYMFKLCCCTGLDFMMDLATHGSNYLVCDGIIQQPRQGEGDDDSDGSWRACDAVQLEMRLDADYYLYKVPYFPSHLVYWTSSTNGFPPIPAGAIPNGDMFQHFSKLSMLKLWRRTFSISSPPFLYCHSLKFLWLDHCHSTDIGATGGEDDMIRQFFRRLRVLDVRYTCCEWILSAQMLDLMTQLRELIVMGAQGWDVGQMRGRLPNIHKLRITKSTILCDTSSSENDLFSGMKNMELLEFSGNHVTAGTTSLSVAANSNSSSHLETVIIDGGCVGVEQISFRGCAKLKNVLLRGGFPQLERLDMSGTAVKTLDLTAMTAWKLNELVLHDCYMLCGILWPPEENMKESVHKLRIDTTEGGSTSAAAGSSPLVVKLGGREPSELNWYISVRDARLLRSIVPMKQYIMSRLWDFHSHVEISTPTSRPATYIGGTTVERIKSGIGSDQQVPVNQQKTEQQPEACYALTYADIAATSSKGVDDGDAPSIAQIWPCPSAPKLAPKGCYTYIQDQPIKTTLRSGEVISSTAATIMIQDYICDSARILHVHDSLSITSIPADAQWYRLEWCRVERCPELDYLFRAPTSTLAGKRMFCSLRTLWASQLLNARFIWNWNRPSVFNYRSCQALSFLHVDFCPRLIHVLPFSEAMSRNVYRSLTILEILWCSDLRAIFPLETDAESYQDHHQQQAFFVWFNHLKRIHLHELPKLHGICGSGRMFAPSLESIKIRGCWSLTRLPSVARGAVECDCEKEWWDRLKWDDNNHKSRYNPTHPKYCKKSLLRGSVLH